MYPIDVQTRTGVGSLVQKSARIAEQGEKQQQVIGGHSIIASNVGIASAYTTKLAKEIQQVRCCHQPVIVIISKASRSQLLCFETA